MNYIVNMFGCPTDQTDGAGPKSEKSGRKRMAIGHLMKRTVCTIFKLSHGIKHLALFSVKILLIIVADRTFFHN
jgi:hypothetical protein